MSYRRPVSKRQNYWSNPFSVQLIEVCGFLACVQSYSHSVLSPSELEPPIKGPDDSSGRVMLPGLALSMACAVQSPKAVIEYYESNPYLTYLQFLYRSSQRAHPEELRAPMTPSYRSSKICTRGRASREQSI